MVVLEAAQALAVLVDPADPAEMAVVLVTLAALVTQGTPETTAALEPAARAGLGVWQVIPEMQALLAVVVVAVVARLAQLETRPYPELVPTCLSALFLTAVQAVRVLAQMQVTGVAAVREEIRAGQALLVTLVQVEHLAALGIRAIPELQARTVMLETPALLGVAQHLATPDQQAVPVRQETPALWVQQHPFKMVLQMLL